MKLENETKKDIIITGDFNADVGALKLNKYTRKLKQITRLHGLTQLIKNPTRVTEDTSSTLDLIFVNNCYRIVTHGVQECGISDLDFPKALLKFVKYDRTRITIREAFARILLGFLGVSLSHLKI